MGGLSKKAFQFEKIRGESSWPLLNLDAGDLLFKDETIAPSLLAQAKITAAGIVKAYNLMQYDAVGIGTRDLAAGLDFLQQLKSDSTFEWLSVNLVRKSTGKPLFTPWIICETGDLAIGIIGLTSAANSSLLREQDDAAIIPWQDILPAVVADLQTKTDMIILLSNHHQEENVQIAAVMPDIHLIIQSFDNTANLPPFLSGNTLITQTGRQGKYFGWLSIHWQPSKTWGSDTTKNSLEKRQRELDSIAARLQRYEARLSAEQLSSHKGYQVLLTAKAKLVDEIGSLEKELLQKLSESSAPATFTSSFITLEAEMPDQPEVKAVVEHIKEQINSIGSSKQAAAANNQGIIQTDGQNTLRGWQACSPCHQQQTQFWQQTGHALAYQTLVDDRQQFNPACLACHVTIDWNAPQADLLNLAPDLQLVGCETCHGPGDGHLQDPQVNSMIERPSQEICMECHQPDRDDNFDYGTDLRKIGCPVIR